MIRATRPKQQLAPLSGCGRGREEVSSAFWPSDRPILRLPVPSQSCNPALTCWEALGLSVLLCTLGTVTPTWRPRVQAVMCGGSARVPPPPQVADACPPRAAPDKRQGRKKWLSCLTPPQPSERIRKHPFILFTKAQFGSLAPKLGLEICWQGAGVSVEGPRVMVFQPERHQQRQLSPPSKAKVWVQF